MRSEPKPEWRGRERYTYRGRRDRPLSRSLRMEGGGADRVSYRTSFEGDRDGRTKGPLGLGRVLARGFGPIHEAN